VINNEFLIKYITSLLGGPLWSTTNVVLVSGSKNTKPNVIYIPMWVHDIILRKIYSSVRYLVFSSSLHIGDPDVIPRCRKYYLPSDFLELVSTESLCFPHSNTKEIPDVRDVRFPGY